MSRPPAGHLACASRWACWGGTLADLDRRPQHHGDDAAAPGVWPGIAGVASPRSRAGQCRARLPGRAAAAPAATAAAAAAGRPTAPRRLGGDQRGKGSSQAPHNAYPDPVCQVFAQPSILNSTAVPLALPPLSLAAATLLTHVATHRCPRRSIGHPTGHTYPYFGTPERHKPCRHRCDAIGAPVRRGCQPRGCQNKPRTDSTLSASREGASSALARPPRRPERQNPCRCANFRRGEHTGQSIQRTW